MTFNPERASGNVVMPNSAADPQRRDLLVKTAALGAAAGAGLLAGDARAQQTRGIEGYKAPEIELDYWIDGDGKPAHFSVMESRGKWVFLKCFQDWCPGCHSSGFPTLQAFAERFHGHPKVAIAAIQTVFEGFSSNTLEDVRKLQLRYDLPVIMGHDPGNPETHERPVTMQAYVTGGTPWLILINPEGYVVYNNFHVNSDKLIEYVAEQIETTSTG
jgi:thiol-disulfide isomerase/thioredoxin